jgi:hypothetical protein
VVSAHVGPPIERRSGARMGPLFAHRKLGRWGFAREKWGWIFLFFVRGGLRESGPKVVPIAHREGWTDVGRGDADDSMGVRVAMPDRLRRAGGLENKLAAS